MRLGIHFETIIISYTSLCFSLYYTVVYQSRFKTKTNLIKQLSIVRLIRFTLSHHSHCLRLIISSIAKRYLIAYNIFKLPSDPQATLQALYKYTMSNCIMLIFTRQHNYNPHKTSFRYFVSPMLPWIGCYSFVI